MRTKSWTDKASAILNILVVGAAFVMVTAALFL